MTLALIQFSKGILKIPSSEGKKEQEKEREECRCTLSNGGHRGFFHQNQETSKKITQQWVSIWRIFIIAKLFCLTKPVSFVKISLWYTLCSWASEENDYKPDIVAHACNPTPLEFELVWVSECVCFSNFRGEKGRGYSEISTWMQSGHKIHKLNESISSHSTSILSIPAYHLVSLWVLLAHI